MGLRRLPSNPDPPAPSTLVGKLGGFWEVDVILAAVLYFLSVLFVIASFNMSSVHAMNTFSYSTRHENIWFYYSKFNFGNIFMTSVQCLNKSCMLTCNLFHVFASWNVSNKNVI